MNMTDEMVEAALDAMFGVQASDTWPSNLRRDMRAALAAALPSAADEPVAWRERLLATKGPWVYTISPANHPEVESEPLFTRPASARPSAGADGWVLVPREPTPEMLEAAGTVFGYDAGEEYADAHHIDWWHSMVDAAPAQPEATCAHEAYLGACVHCGAGFREGRVVVAPPGVVACYRLVSKVTGPWGWVDGAPDAVAIASAAKADDYRLEYAYAAPPPADAVRALVGKWRATANEPMFPAEDERDYLEGENRGLRCCADELERALSAAPVGYDDGTGRVRDWTAAAPTPEGPHLMGYEDGSSHGRTSHKSELELAMEALAHKRATCRHDWATDGMGDYCRRCGDRHG